jgi:hypothetical protein
MINLSLDDIKNLLSWCRNNGIPHIELETLKADIMLIEDPNAPKPEYQPTNLDFIPQFSVDVVHSPLEMDEIKE